MVRVLLLWVMVDYDSSIRYRSVARDMSDFIVGEEEDGVGSFGDARFAFGEAIDFLAKCRYPEISEVCLVMGLTTPKQCSSMLMMGPVHCNWVATLKALRVMT